MIRLKKNKKKTTKAMIISSSPRRIAHPVNQHKRENVNYKQKHIAIFISLQRGERETFIELTDIILTI